MTSKLSVLIIIIIGLLSCRSAEYVKIKKMDIPLISIKKSRLFKGQKPYYFVGTNYWYGPLLGAKKKGDRQRLIRELDLMKSIGIDNLRILVGAEGEGESQISPSLQPQQGIYNQDLLDGLDFLLAQMRKRNMYAILYLNNNWNWSGGMAQYLKWNGYGDIPKPLTDEYTWDDYQNYTKQFQSCAPCMEAFYKHVKFIMGRKNRYTKLKYINDNTIMSWQVANEPRVMMTPEHEKSYSEWLIETVDLIDSLDPVHLISTGAEGKAGFLEDLDMYKRLHVNAKIDYLTMHIWPKNWGWYDKNNEPESLKLSLKKTFEYMDKHIEVARSLNKPIVMSEFGFPRNNESISSLASVENRNTYFQDIFKYLLDKKGVNSIFQGLNFWGFAGYGSNNPENGQWKLGDDFTADPPEEPQGLNSVFASDTITLKLIRDYNKRLTN
ncbi:beta-mannanase [Gaetbulibacter sp. M240]|uniref:glycoside hydrolase 5 family protein n=1 Tax=Gaetbulibacter sp. M240 TaxID=3126511 RepID=UPI00374EEC2E